MTKNKEVVSWKAALAADAKKVTDTEGGGGGYISIKAGQMTYQDEPIKDNKLDCVVLASSVVRTFYDRPYDPDDTGPPDCFAISLEAGGRMSPHENVPSPQSDNCKDCPLAEFGSAKVGKGPACKTRRRLMVMPVDGLGDPAEAEIATITIPPTSTKNYSSYANKVATATGLPPWAVKTTISTAPHPKKMFEVSFKPLGPIEGDEALSGIHARIDEANAAITEPYTYDDEDDEPAQSTSTKY